MRSAPLFGGELPDNSIAMRPKSGLARACCLSLPLALLGCGSPSTDTVAAQDPPPEPLRQTASAQSASATDAVQADPDPRTAEAELIKLEQDYARALIQKDRAFLMRFYAPDWRGGNWMGFWTKSDMLKAVLDERYLVKSMDLKDIRVRVIGRVAIVQGHDDEVTRVNGRDTSGRWTFTDIFEHRNGMWVAVASHTAEVR